MTDRPQNTAFLILVLAVCSLTCASVAQGPLPREAESSVNAFVVIRPTPVEGRATHRFWDKGNRILYTANTALTAADFAVTRANLQNRGRELNPMVRVFATATAGLAVNFAGQAAGTVAIGYLFHRAGHHKLERIASLANIGASASAVSYGLAHR
jgi:hypothetical protein